MKFENRLKKRASDIIYYLIRRKGIFSVAIGLGCLPVLYLKLRNGLKRKSLLEDNAEVKDLESNEDSKYIYIDNYDSSQQFLTSTQFLKTLKKTNSHRKAVRHQAVESLSHYSELSDTDAYQFRQLCSVQTLNGLSRHKETNPSFFSHPPPIEILRKSNAYEECLKEKTNCSLIEEFYTLLSMLPSTNDKCVKYFTEICSKMRKSEIEDKGIWLEDEYQSTNKSKKLPEEVFEKSLLQALLRHSLLGTEHCQMIVKNGALQLLTKIYRLRKDNEPMMCLVAKIILVVSVEEKYHHILHAGGWVGILHEWLQSSNIQLSSIAASALANLDSDDKDQPMRYSEGLFLLSPFYRKNEEFNSDVIFIHGIRGSAFGTWRQKDAMNIKNIDKKYTKCWPKDWLSNDTSNIRIIAVDYESEFSEWNMSCSYNKERQLLQARSKELLEKLVAAGVGRRPIIWVSHSMGGLIVKQILVNAATAPNGTSESNIYRQSSGLVFYSVPHIGTSVATKLSTQAQYLFFPSTEVKELQHGSEQLLELHKKFKEILKKKDIPCLSFGEGWKTSFGLNFNAYIVDRESSDIGYGEYHNMPSNHLTVCKPKDRGSKNYTKLLEFIYKNVPKTDISYENIFNETRTADREYFLLAFG